MSDRSVKWTPEEKAKLARHWKSGMTIKRIALELGKSVKGVMDQRRRLGLPTRQTGTLNRCVRLHVSEPLYKAAISRAIGNSVPISTYIRSLIARDTGVSA